MRAFAPEKIDVAGESGGALSSCEDVEIETEVRRALRLIEWPCVAFGGEDGRASCVECAQGMHQRRDSVRLREDGRDRRDFRAGR